MKKIPARFVRFAPEVAQAQRLGKPVVALESTVISHGLPYPENLALARELENVLRQLGVIPATIALLDGLVHIGLPPEGLERLANEEGLQKIGPREISVAIAREGSGGTTVAGTIAIAQGVGIWVFATGGIGGVHRPYGWDVSADLPQLARTPMIVVCSGAKAILDLPATLEFLETYRVPVIGYQTDEFPAFYSVSSGLPVQLRCDSPDEIVQLARVHWELGMESALLVTVPPPPESALPPEAVQSAISQALEEAGDQGLRGQQVTPFLLSRVSQLTGGASLRANLALLRNNARVAGQIALCWSTATRHEGRGVI